MTDNWSLKGKGFAVVSYTPAKIVKEEEAKGKYEILYPKQDIKTLHQKLIEDINETIKEIEQTWKAKNIFNQMCKEAAISKIQELRNRINYRFGVEVEND